jgi:intracellular sulfur oxidation DsrE/DsrF family protein
MKHSANEADMSNPSPSASERRSFLARINAGAATVAALAMGGIAMAQVKSPATTRWTPARHEKDDWMDELPGKHRLIFDTIGSEGLGQALLFANNFMRVNQTDYGLENSDLAVIIVVRHRSTAFGYSDGMWAKYGPALAARARFEDPKTKTPPKTNLFNSEGYGELLPSMGTTMESLSKQGVQFAVCSAATHAMAGSIAGPGGDADAVFRELTSNLVKNARMVPAGIVALNRAQERGYSLVSP